MKERCTQEQEDREVEDIEESDPTEDSQMREIQESQEQEEEEESTEPPLKKRKKQKEDKLKSVKEMSKEEQKRKAEERKALQRERALEKKRAKEKKDKEKVQLKRKEHKAILKRAKALLEKDQPTSTAVCEEEGTSTTAEVHTGPSVAREETDPPETYLVEPGPLLISLNPFEGEDEPIIRPTSGARSGVATVISETIEEEDVVPTKVTGEAPSKKLKAGKAPRKQADPKKNRKAPGSGALKYTLKPKHIRQARATGFLFPDDPRKKRRNHFQPGHLALNEIRHFQKRTNLLIQKLPFQHLQGYCT